MGAAGYHLIDVHIALGSAARLPDYQWELVVQQAAKDLFAYASYKFGLLLWQHAKVVINEGRSLLKVSKGIDNFTRHTGWRANSEVLTAALGLSAPVLVSRNFHIAHRVFLYPVFHDISSFRSGKSDSVRHFYGNYRYSISPKIYMILEIIDKNFQDKGDIAGMKDMSSLLYLHL
jgi:hypothetical protein